MKRKRTMKRKREEEDEIGKEEERKGDNSPPESDKQAIVKTPDPKREDEIGKGDNSPPESDEQAIVQTPEPKRFKKENNKNNQEEESQKEEDQEMQSADSLPDSKIIEIWEAFRSAKKDEDLKPLDEDLKPLSSLIPELQKISLEQLVELLSFSPQEDSHPEKGINVLWYAAHQLEHLLSLDNLTLEPEQKEVSEFLQATFLPKLSEIFEVISQEVFFEILKSSPQSDPPHRKKGMNVLSFACLLAERDNSDLLDKLLPLLEKMSQAQVFELFKSSLQVDSNDNFSRDNFNVNVLWHFFSLIRDDIRTDLVGPFKILLEKMSDEQVAELLNTAYPSEYSDTLTTATLLALAEDKPYQQPDLSAAPAENCLASSQLGISYPSETIATRETHSSATAADLLNKLISALNSMSEDKFFKLLNLPQEDSDCEDADAHLEDSLAILCHACELAAKNQFDLLNIFLLKFQKIPERFVVKLLKTIFQIEILKLGKTEIDNALNFISLFIDRAFSTGCSEELKFNFITLIVGLSSNALQQLDIDSFIKSSCKDGTNNFSETNSSSEQDRKSVLQIISSLIDDSFITDPSRESLLLNFYCFKLSSSQQEHFMDAACSEKLKKTLIISMLYSGKITEEEERSKLEFFRSLTLEQKFEALTREINISCKATVLEKLPKTIFWRACALASSNNPELLNILLPVIESLPPDQGVLLSSLRIGDDYFYKGINALWFACLLAKQNQLSLLNVFISKLEKMSSGQLTSDQLTSDQLIALFMSSYQGVSVLWYACSLAKKNQSKLLNVFISKLKEVPSSQFTPDLIALFIALFTSSPQNATHPDQGLSVLWHACLLAENEQTDLLEVFISKLSEIPPDQLASNQLVELFTSSPQNADHSDRGRNILLYACSLAKKNQPKLLNVFISKLEMPSCQLTSDQLIALFTSSAQNTARSDQGVSFLWYACVSANKNQPALLNAFISKLEMPSCQLTSDQLIALFTSSPQHDTNSDQGMSVLWYACYACFSTKRTQPELLEVFINKLNEMPPGQLTLDQLVELFISSPKNATHSNQGMSVLWYACYACFSAKRTQPELLEVFINKLSEMPPGQLTLDQLVELFTSSPKNATHSNQGMSVLWYACSLAENDQPKLLNVFISKLEEVLSGQLTSEQSEQLMDLFISSPQNEADINKGRNVLWNACFLAHCKQPHLLNTLITLICTLQVQEIPLKIVELLRATPKLQPGAPLEGFDTYDTLNFIFTLLDRSSTYQCPPEIKSNFILFIMKLPFEILQKLDIASTPDIQSASLKKEATNPSEKGRSVIQIILSSMGLSHMDIDVKHMDIDVNMLLLLPEFYLKLSLDQQKAFKNYSSSKIQNILTGLERLHEIFQNLKVSLSSSDIEKLTHEIKLLQRRVKNSSHQLFLDCCYYWIANMTSEILDPKDKDKEAVSAEIGGLSDESQAAKKKLILAHTECLEQISFTSTELYLKAQQALSDSYFIELGHLSGEGALSGESLKTILDISSKYIRSLLIRYIDAKRPDTASESRNADSETGMRKLLFIAIENHFKYLALDTGSKPSISPGEGLENWWFDQWWLNSGQYCDFPGDVINSFNSEFKKLKDELESEQRKKSSESQEKVTELEQKYSTLEKNNKELEQKYSTLEGNNKELQKQYSESQTAIEELKRNYVTAQEQIKGLLARFDDLENNNNLQKSVTTLRGSEQMETEEEKKVNENENNYDSNTSPHISTLFRGSH